MLVAGLCTEVCNSLEVNAVDLLGKAKATKTLVHVGCQRVAANNGKRLGVATETVL